MLEVDAEPFPYQFDPARAGDYLRFRLDASKPAGL